MPLWRHATIGSRHSIHSIQSAFLSFTLQTLVGHVGSDFVMHGVGSIRANQTALYREFEGSVIVLNRHCVSSPADDGRSEKFSPSGCRRVDERGADILAEGGDRFRV